MDTAAVWVSPSRVQGMPDPIDKLTASSSSRSEAAPHPVQEQALPSGTVTFLLTDVEGSTALWEDAPEAMRAALARHDMLFEDAVTAQGGVHIRPRGEGDSRFAVFTSAPDAVTAALTIQRSFTAEEWPTPRPVKVRIGLHTGEAELRDGDYYGTAVNRCARLRTIGHGGHVLLSEATFVLVRDNLPAGTSLLDQGEHRLKDLTRPERVFQLVADDLPADLPPLASLDARPHNLPIQPTVLLGRELEVDDVRQLLRRAETRLVTLTGPGGTGKTRLSLQVAAELVDWFEDGSLFVELAPIGDPALVPSTIAQVVGVHAVGSRPVLESLKEYLRRRSLLLVLDNFEQILPAAPVVSELLATAPGLKVLITSREALRLRGEREYAVPPLALPDAQHRPTPDTLSRCAATALFVERAVDVRDDFAVTAENAAAVAEICVRLDGLPLAIELAAARVRLLTPEAMLARLERRLPLLTGGARDLPARQRTLRDAIAWSYDLLEPDEQALFRRLAVFVGGCTLDSAEATATAEVGDRRWALAAHDVLDGIESLIAKNLLRRVSGPGGASRMAMLETVREYGLEQLAQAGELHAMRRWHRVHFLDLAERAEPGMRGPEQIVWLDRLEAEHDNLRAALTWCLADATDADRALRLAGALVWFWLTRAHVTEGRRWLDLVLERPDGAPVAYLKALHGAGWLAHMQHDAATAQRRADAALTLARDLGHPWSLSFALLLRARVAYFGGDAPTVRPLAEQCLLAAREAGDEWLIAWALHLHALAAHIAGDYPTARGYYEQSLAIRQRIGSLEGIGMCQHLLGMVAYQEGEYEEARRLNGASFPALRQVGLHIVHNPLATLAALAVRLGQPRRAARIAGATQAYGDLINLAPIPLAAEIVRPVPALARELLGGPEFDRAWAEGQAMSLDDAIAEALAVEPQRPADRTESVTAPPGSTAGSPFPAGLSPREIEVLRLIAAGHTSKEVADVLVLSIRTVERHITHVYEKIGARGRADATAFALKHGLLGNTSPA